MDLIFFMTGGLTQPVLTFHCSGGPSLCLRGRQIPTFTEQQERGEEKQQQKQREKQMQAEQVKMWEPSGKKMTGT